MDDEDKGVFGVIAGFIMAIILTALMTADCQRISIQSEAVRAGAAEWRADESGRAEFVWKGGE